MEAGRRQVFAEIANTAALSNPHPIVIIHAVLQTLVEKTNLPQNTRAKKHRWLADKARLVQTAHVKRFRGIAVNDFPRSIDVIAFSVD